MLFKLLIFCIISFVVIADETKNELNEEEIGIEQKPRRKCRVGSRPKLWVLLIF